MWCALDCIILKIVPNILPHVSMSIVGTPNNVMHPGGGLFPWSTFLNFLTHNIYGYVISLLGFKPVQESSSLTGASILPERGPIWFFEDLWGICSVLCFRLKQAVFRQSTKPPICPSFWRLGLRFQTEAGKLGVCFDLPSFHLDCYPKPRRKCAGPWVRWAEVSMTCTVVWPTTEEF